MSITDGALRSSPDTNQNVICEMTSNKKPHPEMGQSLKNNPLYVTLAKMMTSVNSTSDSMNARPRISAS